MITKEELLQMLSDTESYNIERTESTGNMDKFCQAICAHIPVSSATQLQM